VRWLDLYIDHLHQSSMKWGVGSLLDLGPFSRVGSVGNVIICGAIGVGTLLTGITGQPEAYAVAGVAALLDVVFVRVCVRAFRGDFDEFVLDSDEGEEPGLDTPR
jgi:hypothetical protein